MSFAAYSLWMLGHKRLINSSWVSWVTLCDAENAETPSDPWIHRELLMFTSTTKYKAH